MIEQIARICHEANRAFCESIGDGSQLPWQDAPEWQKASAMQGVKAHFEALKRGEVVDARSSRENWVRLKRESGWKYGPLKNFVTKEHPCLIAYDALPAEEKVKDRLFAGIVNAFLAATTE